LLNIDKFHIFTTRRQLRLQPALFDLSSIDTAAKEARLVHALNRGYFSVLRKENQQRPSQKSFAISQIEHVSDSLSGLSDTYFSQSSFILKNRQAVNLANLGCSFVDIDCYNIDQASTDEFVSRLVDRATFMGIPAPSYIIASGRGLYLKWLYKAPLSAANLNPWKALQATLVNLYKSLGADMAARDSARVLRLVGTVNSKSQSPVKPVWCSGIRYDFQDLLNCALLADVPDMLLCESRDKDSAAELIEMDASLSEDERAALILTQKAASKSKADEARQVRQLKRLEMLKNMPAKALEDLNDQQSGCLTQLSQYSRSREPIMLRHMTKESLNWSRFIDLRDLAIARGGLHRGKRDLTLFWMCNFLAQSKILDPSNFESEVHELVKCFPGQDFRPLEEQSLSSLYRRLEKSAKGEKISFNGREYSCLYTPSNDTLINLFEITSDEQRGLNTIIDSREKCMRADAKVPGRSERREARSMWRNKALALAQESTASGEKPNITKIALEVNIHKTQVSRLLGQKIGGPRKEHVRKPRCTATQAASQPQDWSNGSNPKFKKISWLERLQKEKEIDHLLLERLDNNFDFRSSDRYLQYLKSANQLNTLSNILSGTATASSEIQMGAAGLTQAKKASAEAPTGCAILDSLTSLKASKREKIPSIDRQAEPSQSEALIAQPQLPDQLPDQASDKSSLTPPPKVNPFAKLVASSAKSHKSKTASPVVSIVKSDLTQVLTQAVTPKIASNGCPIERPAPAAFDPKAADFSFDFSPLTSAQSNEQANEKPHAKSTPQKAFIGSSVAEFPLTRREEIDSEKDEKSLKIYSFMGGGQFEKSDHQIHEPIDRNSVDKPLDTESGLSDTSPENAPKIKNNPFRKLAELTAAKEQLQRSKLGLKPYANSKFSSNRNGSNNQSMTVAGGHQLSKAEKEQMRRFAAEKRFGISAAELSNINCDYISALNEEDAAIEVKRIFNDCLAKDREIKLMVQSRKDHEKCLSTQAKIARLEASRDMGRKILQMVEDRIKRGEKVFA
jgi:hypothetical protein